MGPGRAEMSGARLQHMFAQMGPNAGYSSAGENVHSAGTPTQENYLPDPGLNSLAGTEHPLIPCVCHWGPTAIRSGQAVLQRQDCPDQGWAGVWESRGEGSLAGAPWSPSWGPRTPIVQGQGTGVKDTRTRDQDPMEPNPGRIWGAGGPWMSRPTDVGMSVKMGLYVRPDPPTLAR